MDTASEAIQKNLETVSKERARRAADPTLDHRVQAVKLYQHRRFEHTYADLLSDPRYARAARFFLDELYGPHDFGERDEQFSRIVPAIVRLFSKDIVRTVMALAELHALSEVLDSKMAEHLHDSTVIPEEYKGAWQATARPKDRLHQIELMQQIGKSLDTFTANPILRHSLKLMRRPAQAAGFGTLQHLLERGFDTFREMRGASYFLQTIGERERAMALHLFESAATRSEDIDPDSK